MLKSSTLIFLMAVVITASGCAHSPQVKSYPYQHRMFDYRVAWETIPAGNSLSVEGLLQNVRWAYIYSIDLTVTLLKQNGTRKSGMDLPIPQSSRLDEAVPFQVTLRDATLEQGDQLEFYIHYKATEGQDGGVDWRSSFRADALTGRVVEK